MSTSQLNIISNTNNTLSLCLAPQKATYDKPRFLMTPRQLKFQKPTENLNDNDECLAPQKSSIMNKYDHHLTPRKLDFDEIISKNRKKCMAPQKLHIVKKSLNFTPRRLSYKVSLDHSIQNQCLAPKKKKLIAICKNKKYIIKKIIF